MIPFLISLLGICVTGICLYVLIKSGGAWYRRKFGEAIVKDVKDARSYDSKDSIG